MAEEKDEKDGEGKRYFDKAYDLKTTDETKQHYAQWAEVYDLEIGEEKGYRQPERCARALAAAGLETHAAVLDVGCGTGLSGRALAAAGYETIDGCDLSPEMLSKAQATGVYRRLFEADLNHPPLDASDGQYGAAACVGVFSFGHVQPDAIDDILRVLRPGGYLVIGLNDHYFEEGSFPAKLAALEKAGTLTLVSKEHGAHLENVEGSTGWVFVHRKN
ncbi:MAG: class I SAM-dependent methyltransferase [Nitratireductor sp.]|nr:class I SAM-dependent methyltransferase [Nitratireductor sp.]